MFLNLGGFLPLTKSFWKIGVKKLMEHIFLGHSSGKFLGATEHLKRYSCLSRWNVHYSETTLTSPEVCLVFAQTVN